MIPSCPLSRVATSAHLQRGNVSDGAHGCASLCALLVEPRIATAVTLYGYDRDMRSIVDEHRSSGMPPLRNSLRRWATNDAHVNCHLSDYSHVLMATSADRWAGS